MRLACNRRGRAAALIGLGLCAATLSAQKTTQRYAITASEVAQSLHVAGLDVSPAQISMPLFLDAATSDPKLQVSQVDQLAIGELRVRIICEQPHECIPFFATVHGMTATDVSALKRLGAQITSAPALYSLLQPGQRTTLLMENQHIRITVPVIAIDSGRPGTEIRVSSMDRKQTYRGVVTDDRTVRGELP